MANINFTIDDAVVDRVLDAFSSKFNYDADRDGTKAALVKAKVKDYIINIVKEEEVKAALLAAEANKDTIINNTQSSVDTDISIT